MHDRRNGQTAGHHSFIVSANQALNGERVLEAATLPATERVALEVREAAHGAQVLRMSHTQLARMVVGLMQGVLGMVVRVVGVQHGATLASRMLHPQELETLAATEEAAVLKHVSTVRMQGPEAALARLVGAPGDLDEAVVEGKVVPE